MSASPMPANQKEAVLQHMLRGNSIDFVMAANLYGVSQLTGRIAELRGEGWQFDKRTQTGKNRYGHTFRKVYYSNPRKGDGDRQ